MARGWREGPWGARAAAVSLGLALGCGSEAASGPGFDQLSASAGAAGTLGGGGATPTGGSAGAGGEGGGPGPAGGGGYTGGPIGGDRPVTVHVPPGYDPAVPAPLLLLLHGYGAPPELQELYLSLTEDADARGMLYAIPSGTIDQLGMPFWNATDACCDLFGSGVDDSAYLGSVIDQIEQAYAVDPRRVYVVGHSNGGFMAHRLACDHAEAIAAIASLAGATYEDESQCQPAEPVSVLVAHGTLDATVAYGGGEMLGHAFPGAVETAETWATLDGCALVADKTSPSIDLTALPGDETEVWRWDIGCEPGRAVAHWRIVGGQHVPVFNGSFDAQLLDFLLAHPKP